MIRASDARVTGDTVGTVIPANGGLLYLLGTLTDRRNSEGLRVTASVMMEELLSNEFSQAFSALPPDSQENVKVRFVLLLLLLKAFSFGVSHILGVRDGVSLRFHNSRLHGICPGRVGIALKDYIRVAAAGLLHRTHPFAV